MTTLVISRFLKIGIKTWKHSEKESKLSYVKEKFIRRKHVVKDVERRKDVVIFVQTIIGKRIISNSNKM